MKTSITTILIALELLLAGCNRQGEAQKNAENPAATQEHGTIKPAGGGPGSSDPGTK
jgi:uncharacterized lipoprotein YajG